MSQDAETVQEDLPHHPPKNNKALPVLPGYRQTDIGIIPQDWEACHLGGIVDYTKGFAFRAVDYQSRGVRVIRVSDTTFDDIKDTEAIHISSEKATKYKKWMLKEDDLIISTVGSKPPMYDSMVGKATLVSKSYAGALLNQNAVIIRSYDRDKDTQVLLHNHFRQPRYIDHIEKIFRGNANQASITLKELFEFVVPLPKSAAEKRAVATALSDVDALISSLDRLISKKRAVKTAAMQQLLTGKRRLPGFSGEWEVKRLGDLGTFRGGSGFPIRYQGGVEGQYPFFKVSDMNNVGNATFMVNSNHWISEEVRKQIGVHTLPKNSIVFAKIGAAIFLERKRILSQESLIDNNMMGFVPNDAMADVQYMHFLFLIIQLGTLVSTTALPSLSGKEIADLEFAIPPLEEQTAIAGVLSDMDTEIEALEARREKTRRIKQGMMQELLTGRTRLVPEGA